MESTLYPKITNKIKEALRELRIAPQAPQNADLELALVGTVKLHGTHADILIDNNDRITLQSRNRVELTIELDNHRFAATMHPLSPSILNLKTRYLSRYQELNPKIPIDSLQPLIIAGEWIGTGIQKGVAIAHLPKLFVIVSTSINGVWVDDRAYADIHDEQNNIYHISRSGFYTATLRVLDPDSTMKELQAITDVVYASCPFGKTFGVEGMGEGIVWKIESYAENPKAWFKVKGEKFMMNKSLQDKDPALLAAMHDEKVAARVFVEEVVTERRLEQGWDYLREMGVVRDKKGTGRFLSWVIGDVEVEEKTIIEERGIDQKAMRGEINRVAREWYRKVLKSEA